MWTHSRVNQSQLGWWQQHGMRRRVQYCRGRQRCRHGIAGISTCDSNIPRMSTTLMTNIRDFRVGGSTDKSLYINMWNTGSCFVPRSCQLKIILSISTKNKEEMFVNCTEYDHRKSKWALFKPSEIERRSLSCWFLSIFHLLHEYSYIYFQMTN
jgi:hypothetical protein